ncbi:MAG: 1,4-dihydroxy-6-naphthoate synthase [Thermodesulfovibrionales bacterium]
MKTLSLGYSPCPNDTFIFYGLVHGGVRDQRIRFKESLLDVETLNNLALKGKFDLTKVSFHAYLYLKDQYLLLNAGGALGRGCGPLLVAREPIKIEALRGKRIAIPGLLTTAFLLLRLYNPEYGKNIVVMPFHEILGAVKSGIVDAGLIIHESRFTYLSYGLHEIIDLGRWWEEDTGLPIPLGCIIIKKEYSGIIEEIEGLIRKSISFAYENREKVMPYIRENARELNDSVIERHIDLYVNKYSYDFGPNGKDAIRELLQRAERAIGGV